MSTFWLNDPFVLLQKDHITELWPSLKMSSNGKLNAITRLVLMMSLIGYIVSQNTRFVVVGGLTVAAIVGYYLFSEKKLLKEGFETAKNTLDLPEQGNHTVPTTSNPLMNVLMTDYKDRPTRKSALKNNDDTANMINEKVKSKVISKVGDARIFRGIDNELDLENSMRNFYTTANTAIPNDQEGFSKFCYADMISGQEGNEAALVKRNVRLGQVTV
jgi:hypothetical protein